MSYLTAISFPHAFHRSERCNPYFIDFTRMANGALGGPWTGATFEISSAKLINTPAVGSNLLTDPGLEGSYTGGKNDNLTMTDAGGATWTESADVHGGSKAQKVVLAAFNDRCVWYPQPVPTANSFYRFSVWVKRTDAKNTSTLVNIYQNGQVLQSSQEIAADVYTQYTIAILTGTTGGIFCYPFQELGSHDPGDYNSIVADDGVLEKLTYSTMFAMCPQVNRLNSVKIRPSTLVDGTFSGVAAWADAAASPATYLLAYIRKHEYSDNTYMNIGLLKCVAGTFAQLVADTGMLFASDAWLEIRPTDETHVGLYYNNAQIGADVEVTDVPGKRAGLMIAGGNNIEAFFSGKLIPVTIGWAGSSNTASLIGYRVLATADILKNMPVYNPTHTNISVGGWATWPNLVNAADLAAADLVIFDQSNDGSDDAAHVEAFVRKLWAQGNTVLVIVLPAWAAGTDMTDNGNISTYANATAITNELAICTAYGIPVINAVTLFTALVPGTYNLNDLMADTAHMTAAGYQVIETALRDYLINKGASQPGTLPTRINAACEDFENTPVIKLGTAYDSMTGTWATDGTSISSSDVGATITYSGTFRSFGCYRADSTYPDVSVSIDGVVTNPFAFYNNGYDIGTRAAHTVVITVLTTCKIDEFWAI